MRIMMKKQGLGSTVIPFSTYETVDGLDVLRYADLNDDYVVWCGAAKVTVLHRATNQTYDITASAVGTGASGSFGTTHVAINDNNKLVVVDQFDNQAGSNTGAIYLFDISPSTYTLAGKFTNPNPSYVTMTNNAAITNDYIVVGHYYYGTSHQGNVYVLSATNAGLLATVPAPTVYTTNGYFGDYVDVDDFTNTAYITSRTRLYAMDLSPGFAVTGYVGVQALTSSSKVKVSNGRAIYYNTGTNPDEFTYFNATTGSQIMPPIAANGLSQNRGWFDVSPSYAAITDTTSCKIYNAVDGTLFTDLEYIAEYARFNKAGTEFLVGNRIYTV